MQNRKVSFQGCCEDKISWCTWTCSAWCLAPSWGLRKVTSWQTPLQYCKVISLQLKKKKVTSPPFPGTVPLSPLLLTKLAEIPRKVPGHSKERPGGLWPTHGTWALPPWMCSPQIPLSPAWLRSGLPTWNRFLRWCFLQGPQQEELPLPSSPWPAGNGQELWPSWKHWKSNLTTLNGLPQVSYPRPPGLPSVTRILDHFLWLSVNIC